MSYCIWNGITFFLIQQETFEQNSRTINESEAYTTRRVGCSTIEDHRRLHDILFKAAWNSNQETLQKQLATPGLVLTIQTAGKGNHQNTQHQSQIEHTLGARQ